MGTDSSWSYDIYTSKTPMEPVYSGTTIEKFEVHVTANGWIISVESWEEDNGKFELGTHLFSFNCWEDARDLLAQLWDDEV